MYSSQQVQQLFAGPIQDPFRYFSDVRDILKMACSQAGQWSPRGPKASRGHRFYREAAELLQELGFFELAETLLLEWWDDLAEIQQLTKKRVYRAVCAVG